MQPETPRQIFVVLMTVTAFGLLLATVAESDILEPATSGVTSERAPGEPGRSEATADEPRTPRLDDETVPTDEVSIQVPSAELIDGVPQPDPTVDEFADFDRAGEAPVGVDPSQSGEVAAAPLDAQALAAEGAPAEDDWQPLTRADRGDACVVRLNRATMAAAIERREPRATEGPFVANGEPIYVFLDFANPTGVAQPITVRWRQNRTGVQHFDEIEAGTASRWRTWAERPLPLDQLGPWTVQVLDAERCLLSELEFTLAAPTW